ncbi:MAG: class I SAM-dependent methyltransferase [Nitrospirae bacterium]|nr:class I SAM-dependent methyltransferase [Magnetococcales bacterium]
MDRYLTEDEKGRIRELYGNRLKDLGPVVETVGWRSKEDQVLRFQVLTRGITLRGCRVMDVGCGLGDLIPFLDQQTGGDYDYLGIDLTPTLVDTAQSLYGGPGRRFLTGDILQMDDLSSVDVVLMSGALSFRIGDNVAFAKTMLERMFALSRGVVAANFLTSYVDYQLEKNFHYPPELLFSFSKSLTRWVTLMHDYPLWEFTLQLRHEARQENI